MTRSPLTTRRKALRRRSAKARAYAREIAAILPALRERSENMCEVCNVDIAAHCHHRLRRSQGGTNDLTNLLHVCSDCHTFIHAHPAESFERGWLRHMT